jgi:hypothetical protein
MASMKHFTSKSNLPEKLVRSTVKQLAGWDDFQVAAQDISRYGADGGFHGFVYYKDTVSFFKRNRKEIMHIAEEQAKDFGVNVLDMIAGFNCMKSLDITQGEIATAIYTGKGEMVDQVYNCLAWYAAEEVSRSFADYVERDMY